MTHQDQLPPLQKLAAEYRPTMTLEVLHSWASEAAKAIAAIEHSRTQQAQECTRSHPHEMMSPMCEFRAEIARLTNENKRLKMGRQAVQVSDEQIDRICYLATEIRFAKTDDDAQAVIDKIRAILALRPAQATAAQGEPVAWRWRNMLGEVVVDWQDYKAAGRKHIEQQVADFGGTMEYAYPEAQPAPVVADEAVSLNFLRNIEASLDDYHSGAPWGNWDAIQLARLKELIAAMAAAQKGTP